MSNLVKELTPTASSSIIQKIILAISGLVLIAFIIFHLLGNLTILGNSANFLNIYADRLERLGIGRQILEIVLAIAFVVHIFYAITIARTNNLARSEPYYRQPNGFGNFWRSSFVARSSIYTGLLLLLFIVVHVKTMMFGMGTSAGYTIEVDGRSIRDLERSITEMFGRPIDAICYILMTIPLGLHLRHGLKSAWQSLGINIINDGLFDRLSLVVAIGISMGFAIIPIWIYLGGN